ncbi:unnamed protein product [Urochloa decumbens]|uniref:RING-type domain-containing protein n=1 Tax=Urochloa decumbens TaxID=240449 RepID=A0ABC9C0T3_9POAL
MSQGTRRASAAATAGPRPDTAAPLPPGLPPRRSTRRGRSGGGSAGAGGSAAEALVRRAVVAPCFSCGICGGILQEATAFSECIGACKFCRECLYDKLANEDIKCCPTCGIHLGRAPLEKLRPDHSLQRIRSVIFPAKRRKVVTAKIRKTKENFSAKSTLSTVVDIVTEGSTAPLPPAASQIEDEKIEVEVINEADEALLAQESVYESSILNLAPVGRDALSRIRCRDFYSACHPSAETGALVVWQPPPILEEMVAHYQLAPRHRQDSQASGHPATSDTEYQQQAPAVQITHASAVAGSSFQARTTVQDDANLREDILALFNERNARIMGRYDAYISQLKADNSKLIAEMEERHQRELENERAAAAESTRILEERLQREFEYGRAAAAERIRILKERLQRESKSFEAENARLQRVSQSLEAENARLYEELENGRADKQALVTDILEKSDELATIKYYSDIIESDKTCLENEVEDLKKELEYAKKVHDRYVQQVQHAAWSVPNNMESIHSDGQL